MPSEIEAVAAEAWNAVKDKADPEFGDCASTHREKLVTHAVSVRDKGLPSGAGGTAEATDFEKKVHEILTKPTAKAKAKEK